jgi:predicted RNA methylase
MATQTGLALKASLSAGVDCFGESFVDDGARREHYRDRLRGFLADPDFRSQPGFPNGTDEDIIAMSDPPFFTACPNPFAAQFTSFLGTRYDTKIPYSRAPMAVDVSVGKTDPLYRAHGYHTKVPHQAIVPSILHYTEPSDIILDAFGGSGMTGVAAAFCAEAPQSYRDNLEREWANAGRHPPKWGARYAIINDLSPAAAFIAANYTTPFDVDLFDEAFRKLLDTTRSEIGWMYETLGDNGKAAEIRFTAWSEVFTCPICAGEIIFSDEAIDSDTGKVLPDFKCPHCDKDLKKGTLKSVFETTVDPGTKQPWRRLKFRPSKICYQQGGKRGIRNVTKADHDLCDRIAALPLPPEVPTVRFPIEAMEHGSRIAPKGFTHVHHFFLPRAAHAMATMWRLVEEEQNERVRKMLVFAVEQAIVGSSMLNRYVQTHYSQVNRNLSGVYYIPSMHAECSPWYSLDGRLARLVSAFKSFSPKFQNNLFTVGTAASLPIPDRSIDYVFTDPPFGQNIPYADLNFLVESWHRVTTASKSEATIDGFKDRDLSDYQKMMTSCFREYFRVLKPGRWMTVVFSNSKASVWNSIQVSLQQAGFVVAEVTALDKTQGSFRQITAANTVKQDLVVSCYKPNGGLEERFDRGLTDDTAWDFVRTHLKNLAVIKHDHLGNLENIAERDPRRIFDRMVAWFIRHNTPVPISNAEFQSGILERFLERNGMVFLPIQVDAYDRESLLTGGSAQRNLFVDDERSAIEWLADILKAKPSTYQELHPEFTQKTITGWRQHEKRAELLRLLDDNFLIYDGHGPVPNQIHSYLSSNWKELRNLDKGDKLLTDKARNRWFVPDPNKQKDVERRRDKALLKEFDGYRNHKGTRLSEVRLEVLRAGFRAAWTAKDFIGITSVAAKIPEGAWQEDERLLMLYSMAESRLDRPD